MGTLLNFKRKHKAPLDWRQKITQKKQQPTLTLIAAGLVLGVLIGAAIVFRPAPNLSKAMSASAPRSAYFGLCYTGGGANCVVDGDTVWIDGGKVRIADIDAPETHPSRCEYEARLGIRATTRLQELLNEGPIQLDAVDRDIDIYGRKLRVVTRNGESLGLKLVNEGLARKWTGSRQPWC